MLGIYHVSNTCLSIIYLSIIHLSYITYISIYHVYSHHLYTIIIYLSFTYLSFILSIHLLHPPSSVSLSIYLPSIIYLLSFSLLIIYHSPIISITYNLCTYLPIYNLVCLSVIYLLVFLPR